MQNSNLVINVSSPKLNMTKFQSTMTVENFGVNLTTFNPENGLFLESIEIVAKNKMFAIQ